MSTEPLTFPNLVTGFERNPQHAARAALYTRYTPAEWTNHCISTYSEADTNRNQSERLRSDAVRLMRETDEKTSQGKTSILSFTTSWFMKSSKAIFELQKIIRDSKVVNGAFSLQGSKKSVLS